MVKKPSPLTEIHPERVARRLEALRYAVGLGPSEFADTVGIDRSSYSKIEAGTKPLKIDMGYAVAVRWGVSMDYLYMGYLREADLPSNLATIIRTRLIGQ